MAKVRTEPRREAQTNRVTSSASITSRARRATSATASTSAPTTTSSFAERDSDDDGADDVESAAGESAQEGGENGAKDSEKDAEESIENDQGIRVKLDELALTCRQDGKAALREFYTLWQAHRTSPTQSSLEKHSQYKSTAGHLLMAFEDIYTNLSAGANKDLRTHIGKVREPSFLWSKELRGIRLWVLLGPEGCKRTFLKDFRRLEELRMPKSKGRGGEDNQGEAGEPSASDPADDDTDDDDDDKERGLSFATAMQLLEEARHTRRGGHCQVKRGTSFDAEWQPLDCKEAMKLAQERFGLIPPAKRQAKRTKKNGLEADAENDADEVTKRKNQAAADDERDSQERAKRVLEAVGQNSAAKQLQDHVSQGKQAEQGQEQQMLQEDGAAPHEHDLGRAEGDDDFAGGDVFGFDNGFSDGDSSDGGMSMSIENVRGHIFAAHHEPQYEESMHLGFDDPDPTLDSLPDRTRKAVPSTFVKATTVITPKQTPTSPPRLIIPTDTPSPFSDIDQAHRSTPASFGLRPSPAPPPPRHHPHPQPLRQPQKAPAGETPMPPPQRLPPAKRRRRSSEDDDALFGRQAGECSRFKEAQRAQPTSESITQNLDALEGVLSALSEQEPARYAEYILVHNATSTFATFDGTFLLLLVAPTSIKSTEPTGTSSAWVLLYFHIQPDSAQTSMWVYSASTCQSRDIRRFCSRVGPNLPNGVAALIEHTPEDHIHQEPLPRAHDIGGDYDVLGFIKCAAVAVLLIANQSLPETIYLWAWTAVFVALAQRSSRVSEAELFAKELPPAPIPPTLQSAMSGQDHLQAAWELRRAELAALHAHVASLARFSDELATISRLCVERTPTLLPPSDIDTEIQQYEKSLSSLPASSPLRLDMQTMIAALKKRKEALSAKRSLSNAGKIVKSALALLQAGVADEQRRVSENRDRLIAQTKATLEIAGEWERLE